MEPCRSARTQLQRRLCCSTPMISERRLPSVRSWRLKEIPVFLERRPRRLSLQPGLHRQHPAAFPASHSPGADERNPRERIRVPKWQQCNAVPPTSPVSLTVQTAWNPNRLFISSPFPFLTGECDLWHSWRAASPLGLTSIKEEQEDEEICDNYPYESAESTDEHGHSPDVNQDEGSGSPERPNLHFDRVPSLWPRGASRSPRSRPPEAAESICFTRINKRPLLGNFFLIHLCFFLLLLI